MDLSLIPQIKHTDRNNFFLLSGPCAIEGEEMALRIAEKIVSVTDKLEIPYVFKGSFKKANRSRVDSFSGIGDEKALKTVVRSNPGIIELDNGTVKQKVHWNDIEDLELPKVERVSQLKVLEETIAYFIDGKFSSKEEMYALDSDKVESVNVIKDTVQLKAFNLEKDSVYTGIIEVKLKAE